MSHMSDRLVIEKIQEFIQRILSKEINDETLISLTSAQVAAFELFLIKNKINKIINIQSFRLSEFANKATIDDNPKRNDDFVEHNISNNTASINNLFVGCDVQNVDEIRALVKNPDDFKSDEYLGAIFSHSELTYCESQDNKFLTLTGLFCAKEAIYKIDNTLNLNKIEIKHNKQRMPYFSDLYSVSISHSGNVAIACAVKLDLPDYNKNPNSDSHKGALNKQHAELLKSLKNKKSSLALKVVAILTIINIILTIINKI
jgi:phosphopantetheinyl transferase (holo-ACP synthase)